MVIWKPRRHDFGGNHEWRAQPRSEVCLKGLEIFFRSDVCRHVDIRCVTQSRFEFCQKWMHNPALLTSALSRRRGAKRRGDRKRAKPACGGRLERGVGRQNGSEHDERAASRAPSLWKPTISLTHARDREASLSLCDQLLSLGKKSLAPQPQRQLLRRRKSPREWTERGSARHRRASRRESCRRLRRPLGQEMFLGAR